MADESLLQVEAEPAWYEELMRLKDQGRVSMTPAKGLLRSNLATGAAAELANPPALNWDEEKYLELQKDRGKNLDRFLKWDFVNNRPGTRMSKFATKEGIPKTLYHGAMGEWTDTGVRKDKLQQRDHGWFGSGFYLTPNPDDASGYATGDLIGDMFGENIDVTSPNIIPVFANVQNPFDFDNLKRTDVKKINRVLRNYNAPLLPDDDNDYIPTPKGEEIYFDTHSEEIKQRLENASDHITSKLLRDKEVSRRDAMNYNMTNIFREAGYDSAIANDGSEVIIYEPNQVKSMFNQGSYNPLTDDLNTNLGLGSNYARRT